MQHHTHDHQNEYDLSPARLLFRAWAPGTAGVVDPTSKVGVSLQILNYLMAGPIFALFNEGVEKLLWPRHVDMAQSYGIIVASFVTALQGTSIVLLALGPFLLRDTHTTRNGNFVNKLLIGNAPTLLLNIAVSTATLVISTKLSTQGNTGVGFLSAMHSFYVFAIMTDLLVFTSHRLMHFPQSKSSILRWLAKAHRIHHQSGGIGDEVNPIKAAHAHPIEIASYDVAIFFPPMLCMSHPLLHISYRMFAAIIAATNHSSIVFDLGHHGLHHKGHTSSNYGFLGFTDLLAGTTAVSVAAKAA